MYKRIIVLALLATSLEAYALGVGSLFTQLATQSGTQGSGSSVDDVLRQLTAEINTKMPMNVDGSTRLDKVSTEPGRRFIYHYTVIADSKTIDFKQALKPQLKNQLCSSAEAQKFLKNGVSVSYQYQDKDGRELGGAEFTPSDCGY